MENMIFFHKTHYPPPFILQQTVQQQY